MSFSSYLPQEDTTDSGLARLIEKWPTEGGSFIWNAEYTAASKIVFSNKSQEENRSVHTVPTSYLLDSR